MMVQRKILDQYLTSGKVSMRSSQSFRRYPILKTLTKNFNVKFKKFCDLDFKVIDVGQDVQYKTSDQYLTSGKISTGQEIYILAKKRNAATRFFIFILLLLKNIYKS